MGRFSTNIKTLLTNTEDDVEAFECDEVGDGDASLVLLLLRFCLRVKVKGESERVKVKEGK